MKNIQTAFLCTLIASLLSWVPAVYAQSAVKAELLMKEPVSSIEGKLVTVFRTEFPPGYNEVKSHRHPGESFVYVLSGRIINQMEDEEPRLYQAGDFFFEPAGALHQRFENADPDKPAVYIIFGIRPVGEY